MLPLITITDATPQKTSELVGLSTSTTSDTSPASSSKTTDHRLLYRGALSLPDSYLQLDGIAFLARLPNRNISALQDSPSCSLSRAETSLRELMYNPLALALESMRGRQTLRFKGTVSLDDVWTDDTGDVYMDIHPFATLTRIYFENILCLSPLVAPVQDALGPKRTQIGVRVSLGDTDEPEATDIVIYGETSAWLHPPPLQLTFAATSTSVGLPPLSLRVARITPAPRAPRPDDPTPRRPPTRSRSTTLSDLGKHTRITPRSSGHGKGKEREKEMAEDHVWRRARDVMLHLPRSNVNGHGEEKEKGVRQREGGFKVPELPTKVRWKQGSGGTDVFGTVERPQPASGMDGKGKQKENVDSDTRTVNPIEDANKLVIKKMAVQCLSNAGIARSHSDFKDIFGFVYRGAAFALRSRMSMVRITAQAAQGAVEAHVKMYVVTDGHDGSGNTGVEDAGG